jgi:hypothetical protein
MSPPLKLTDSQITTVMQLSRPILPDQHVAFVELLTAKLNGRREIGDGELHRTVRTIIADNRWFDPPLGEHGHVRGVGKYA